MYEHGLIHRLPGKETQSAPVFPGEGMGGRWSGGGRRFYCICLLNIPLYFWTTFTEISQPLFKMLLLFPVKPLKSFVSSSCREPTTHCAVEKEGGGRRGSPAVAEELATPALVPFLGSRRGVAIF